MKRAFGLIGKKLGHSFSKKYFTEKFEEEGIEDAFYELYELATIDEFTQLLANDRHLVGLNVTVPYKEAVIPFLDEIDDAAARIGAVNTISVKGNKTKGYNTDYVGFRDSLQQFYPQSETGKALVLGTGGASKAVCAALSDIGIPYKLVSRKSDADSLLYEEVTPVILYEYNLITNTTPLGMQPDTSSCPPIPYTALTSRHYLYDLVYNPENTVFLDKGRQAGAHTKNGLEMLYRQAEAAWEIWNRT